jgi:hypothetical protein
VLGLKHKLRSIHQTAKERLFAKKEYKVKRVKVMKKSLM